MSRLICIVLAILILFAFSGCDESPAGAGGSKEPANTIGLTIIDPTSTATTIPDTTASTVPGTTQPDVTATAPDNSTQPDESSSADATGTPQPSKTPKPSSTPAKDGTLSVDPVIGRADVDDHLTLRKSASSTSKSLAEIPKDGEFTVLMVETGKKWLKVKYEDLTGYVQAKYVSVGSDEGDRVCTVFCNSVLNVREGAGTKYDVIGSVAYGTTLIVKSKKTVSGKTWYEVEIGSSTGYVISTYCRIAED